MSRLRRKDTDNFYTIFSNACWRWDSPRRYRLALKSLFALTDMDWRSTEMFYELIYRILLLIGVELIRTLVTHDLTAVWTSSLRCRAQIC